MAEAMIKGLLNKKSIKPQQISTSGLRASRLKELSNLYAIHTSTSNTNVVQDADIVLFTTKPQSFKHVAAEIKPHLKPGAFIISIQAGVSLSNLVKHTACSACVRAMPNTPAQIGAGMSVWVATPEVDDLQKQRAQYILAALGAEIGVEDEDYLDMATALIGTGPAYVFMFMEAMTEAGVHMGFPRHISEKLVKETVKGAVLYSESSSKHLVELRNQVTSPGGTTAAALYQLEKGGFRTVISNAIFAAYQRSIELGAEKKKSSLDAIK